MSKGKRTTTQRGLGWEHQQRREKLLKAHVDGTPCPCQPGCGPACVCADTPGGLPMYRDAALNIDGRPLEADHTLARGIYGTTGNLADRLLISTCNRSRGTGEQVALVTSREW